MENDKTKQIFNQTEIPAEFFSAKILRLIFIVIGSLLIPLALGLFMGSTSSKTITKTREVYKLVESTNTVISPEVLDNQMFSEWSGRIKGKVIGISTNHVELSSVREVFANTGRRAIVESDNPNTTTIIIRGDFTEFFAPEYSTTGAEFEVRKIKKNYSDIVIGDILEGTVIIEHDDILNKSNLIGRSLSIRKPE